MILAPAMGAQPGLARTTPRSTCPWPTEERTGASSIGVVVDGPHGVGTHGFPGVAGVAACDWGSGVACAAAAGVVRGVPAPRTAGAAVARLHAASRRRSGTSRRRAIHGRGIDGTPTLTRPRCGG